MPRGVPLDLVGQRFGGWTVTRKLGTDHLNQVQWCCTCDCGNTSTITTSNLVSGRSTRCRSCGNSREFSSRWKKS